MTISPPVEAASRRYASVRRRGVSLEWYAVTREGNTVSIRSMSCDVITISGTSISTLPPRASVRAIRCMYISVLPEPVTPHSSAGLRSSNAPSVWSSARC